LFPLLQSSWIETIAFRELRSRQPRFFAHGANIDGIRYLNDACSQLDLTPRVRPQLFQAADDIKT